MFLTTRSNQRGFTLVELLLATAVFSIALVAITAALIQLFKMYQSGISIRKTQHSARVISEELTVKARAAQTVIGEDGWLCMVTPEKTTNVDGNSSADAVRYSLSSGKLMKQSGVITYPAGAPACDSSQFSAVATQVSDKEVYFEKFDGGASQGRLMDIDMRIRTESAGAGEIDRSDPDNPICNPGYEYCSMTTIKKSIMARSENIY